jgi:hypothetical protein
VSGGPSAWRNPQSDLFTILFEAMAKIAAHTKSLTFRPNLNRRFSRRFFVPAFLPSPHHRGNGLPIVHRNSIPAELAELEKLKVIRIDREKKWIAFNFLVAEWQMVQIGNMDSEKVSKLVIANQKVQDLQFKSAYAMVAKNPKPGNLGEMLPDLDSNQDEWIQSPLSYH